MNTNDNKNLQKATELIKVMANNRKDGDLLIMNFITKLTTSSALQERIAWEKASTVLGPKNREKLLNERWKDVNQSQHLKGETIESTSNC